MPSKYCKCPVELFREHQAGKLLGMRDTGIRMKGRRSTPGRYFHVAEPGTGWGGTNVSDPLDIVAGFNPKVARSGMTMLMVSTTGEHYGFYRLDEALRPIGLTNGQFSLLMSLNRPEPAGMASVATLLAMDRTTLTAALKPLERRGLVTVAKDPTDRRGRRLSLTPEGKTLLATAVPIWEQTHRDVEALLQNADKGVDPDHLRKGLLALS